MLKAIFPIVIFIFCGYFSNSAAKEKNYEIGALFQYGINQSIASNRAMGSFVPGNYYCAGFNFSLNPRTTKTLAFQIDYGIFRTNSLIKETTPNVAFQLSAGNAFSQWKIKAQRSIYFKEDSKRKHQILVGIGLCRISVFEQSNGHSIETLSNVESNLTWDYVLADFNEKPIYAPTSNLTYQQHFASKRLGNFKLFLTSEVIWARLPKLGANYQIDAQPWVNKASEHMPFSLSIGIEKCLFKKGN